MEHVYGILLDEKFLYRSVHAAFVNTQWYEAWLERTLFLDPIIFDMWGPGVLSWAPGQPCNSHHARHTGQDTLVVPCLRCVSFLYNKTVGGRGCGQQPNAFFSQRRILGWSQRSSLILIVSHAIALCVFRRVSPLLVYFRRVSPLLVFLLGFRRVSPLLVFLLGLRCQQMYGAIVVFLVLSVCVIEFLGHASRAHRDGRFHGTA